MRESTDPNRAGPASLRRRRRARAVVLCALALAAGCALASCGEDDETTPPTTETTDTLTTTTAPPPPPPPPGPTEVRVRVVGGAPQSGIVRESVDQGDRVVVIVTSDVSDHVHVHGYDLVGDVAPGKRARIAFRASVPGRFVIEFEDRHAQIAELTVEP